jgi:hypothetical protein
MPAGALGESGESGETGSGPLSSLVFADSRVVADSRVLAGPYCTMLQP